jgi:uncharacterized protein YcfL
LALVGCTHPVNTVNVAGASGQHEWIATDFGLTQHATVVSSAKKRLENGLLMVQVVIENKNRDSERILCKVEWLDQYGMELTSIGSDWEPKTIHGRETLTIQKVAADPRAIDCRLKLKESERKS